MMNDILLINTTFCGCQLVRFAMYIIRMKRIIRLTLRTCQCTIGRRGFSTISFQCFNSRPFHKTFTIVNIPNINKFYFLLQLEFKLIFPWIDLPNFTTGFNKVFIVSLKIHQSFIPFLLQPHSTLPIGSELPILSQSATTSSRLTL